MKILVTGAKGMLGQAVIQAASGLEHSVTPLDLSGSGLNVDITDDIALSEAFRRVMPDVVVNCAAIIDMAVCDNDPLLAWNLNTRSVGVLAGLCREVDAKLVQVSTDHYYHGDGRLLHDENAEVVFPNEYARTKFAGEAFALSNPTSLVVRTNIIGFRGHGKPTFAEWAFDAVENDRDMTLFGDSFVSCIDIDSFAEALFKLVDKGAHGLYNVASRDVFSKKELIETIADLSGCRLSRAKEGSVAQLDVVRADSCGLDVRKAEGLLGAPLPTLSDVVQRLVFKKGRTHMKVNTEIIINDSVIGLKHPTYFIADIAANHDGDLERAKDLIWLAAEAGADAAKFQHFQAESIVSQYGFEHLKTGMSHQDRWEKSVFEVYKDASVSLSWTETLIDTCKKAKVDFFTTPYAMEIIDEIDPFVPAYKVGSGDITWMETMRHMASKGKPILLATGASNLHEVEQAVDAILELNSDLVLMQCNTNYTASLENFKYIHLNVLKTYAAMYPEMVLGLSDHTPGHSTVLGSVALGARVIEKHFTDDNHRVGPDHKFAMNPATWKEMVDRTRELELALGSGVKKVEENEEETVVVQRRSVRAARDLSAGEELTEENLEVLRPCPAEGIAANHLSELYGMNIRRDLPKGEVLSWVDVE